MIRSSVPAFLLFAVSLPLAGQIVPLHEDPPLGRSDEPPAVRNAPCVAGVAAGYPCSNVDLLAFVPRSVLGAPSPETLNDVWGWTDSENGYEYAIVGLSNGVAFVDVTDPTDPHVLGRLPTRTGSSPWRGVKVYQHYLYVIADRAGQHGVQIFDLHRLRSHPHDAIFNADGHYFGTGYSMTAGEVIGSAHNIAVNEPAGFAYVVGARSTCNGGLHMINLQNPLKPRFAGCFRSDGYTHDVQCVIYRGADREHDGKEVCFAANEDTLTFVDVTDKKRPRMLSRSGYAGAAYTHQGWLTADHNYFVVNDELDEVRNNHNTRTLIWDVRDLERPLMIGSYFGPTRAIDHNLFIRDGYVFEANYKSGLRVLTAENVQAGSLREVGFIDIVPDDEEGFGGAWGNYPFFPSGTVLISGMDQGLYIVRPSVLRKTANEGRSRSVRP